MADDRDLQGRERLMEHTIPYTYWAYFARKDRAADCAAELSANCLVGVGPAVEPVDDGLPWLLRAARDVPYSQMEEIDGGVEAMVERHGGVFDGGETGWFSLVTGDFVRASGES